VKLQTALHTAALLSIAASRAVAQRPLDHSALAARVDALTRAEASAGRLSGIMMVARGDRVLVRRTWGFADWERRVPSSASTRFGIASITKVMTETLVDQLADSGRLDLSAPVAKYLPGFPDGPAGGHPTVRDLLTHRAGVPWRVTTPLEETQALYPADIVERVKAKGLLFEPGTQELYSSAGFTCLARIVEVVENKPFDEVLARHIFRPALMRSATGETGVQLMRDRALPYRLGAGPVSAAVSSAPYKNLVFLTGAGSLYATGDDMLHFVRALHNGTFGSVAQKQLGAPADTEWVGWYGRINGYEASVDVLPAQELVFIFLSNLQSTANWQIRAGVLNILKGRAVATIASVPAVAPPFESYSAVVGSYGDPGDPADTLVISEAEGRLFRDGDEIYPIAGGWYYEPGSSLTMRFGRDATGAVETLVTRYACCGRKERTLQRIRR
jgi:CubicO group peptidase (beta-lactamase class C family)